MAEMANEKGDTALKKLSIAGLIFSLLAFVCIVVALTTNHWQDIEVDRAGLMKIVEYKPELLASISADPLYFDGNRGLFYQCRAFVRQQHSRATKLCVREFALDESARLNLSHVGSPDDARALVSDLRLRNALVVVVMVSMMTAAVAASFAAVIGLVAVFVEHRAVHTAAMALVIVAMICTGGAMTSFHGVDFLERTRLGVGLFPAVVEREPAYRELRTYTTIGPSYSYYFGWVGLLMACASAIVLLHARKRSFEGRFRRPPRTASSSSASVFDGHKERTRTPSRSTINSLPSTQYSAYDMMESSNSSLGEAGDAAGDDRRAPPAGDWNPYNELPRDYR